MTACPYCESDDTVKNGFNYYSNLKVQKHKCEDCKKIFSYSDRLPKTHLSSEIISDCFDLYLNGLSYRVIARHINEKYRLKISHTNVYFWIQTYTPIIHNYLEQFTPKLSAVWQMDETVIDFKGRSFWCWIAIDTKTRFLIATHLSVDRTMSSGQKFFDKIKKCNQTSKVISTDGNPVYPALIKEYFPDCKHLPIKLISVKPNTSFIERLNGTVKNRTKTMRGFDELHPSQTTFDAFRIHYNFLRPHMSLKDKTPAEVSGINLNLQNRWVSLVRASIKRHQP